ncbi:uncharacterized protein TNCV_4045931 [Trichonephila clavipes]|nr:uncharacterized protein TNCV_4045931 [Trichonephila clavipes]
MTYPKARALQQSRAPAGEGEERKKEDGTAEGCESRDEGLEELSAPSPPNYNYKHSISLKIPFKHIPFFQIRELQETMVTKEDFVELLQRVNTLEIDKVSREELGRLLEPGFIDNFIEEQQNLRTELEEMKQNLAAVDQGLKDLITRIDEEIVKDIQKAIDEINENIAKMKEKLDTLDADDINDSFARLEEQSDMILKELEELQRAQEEFEKQAKASFKKISDVSTLLDRLEATKADKSKMYELLELSHTPGLALHTTVTGKCPSSSEDEQEKQGENRDR